MKIITVALLAIASTAFIIIMKELKPDFAVLVSVAFGVAVLLYMRDPISKVISVFNEIAERSGIDNELLSSAVKVMGISLIAEFAASVCADAGQSAIAARVEAAGKITILALALPIITNMLDLIFSVLS